MQTKQALVRACVDSDVDQHRGHICSEAATTVQNRDAMFFAYKKHTGFQKAVRSRIREIRLVVEIPYE